MNKTTFTIMNTNMESRNLNLEFAQEPFANEQKYNTEHVRLMKKNMVNFGISKWSTLKTKTMILYEVCAVT